MARDASGQPVQDTWRSTFGKLEIVREAFGSSPLDSHEIARLQFEQD
jgi:hypothetical protein